MDASGAMNRKSEIMARQYNIVPAASTPFKNKLGELEESASIGRTALRDGGQILTTQISDPCSHRCHKSRLIALATAGNRRQERTIRLHQKTVFRNLAGAIMGWSSLGEGDRAAEADVEAKVQKLVHFIGRSAPAVHHPPGATSLCLSTPQLLEHRFSRVPAVNDHGQIKFDRQIELRPQDIQLLLKILLPKQIEAQLTDRHHTVVLQSRTPQ